MAIKRHIGRSRVVSGPNPTHLLCCFYLEQGQVSRAAHPRRAVSKSQTQSISILYGGPGRPSPSLVALTIFATHDRARAGGRRGPSGGPGPPSFHEPRVRDIFVTTRRVHRCLVCVHRSKALETVVLSSYRKLATNASIASILF